MPLTAGDELVDLVDEEDRVLDTITRRRVRAENLLHRGVGVLVLDEAGRLYVHRRTPTKDIFPSCYDMMVGGMVCAGEAYAAAARRELAEELGIEAAPLVERFRHRYSGPANNCHITLFETCWNGPVRHQQEEIAWGAWMHVDELEAALPGWEVVPDGLELYHRWREETGGA